MATTSCKTRGYRQVTIVLKIYFCDPVGIQTQDLQNRNLTLYSAKLQDLTYAPAHTIMRNASAKVIKLFQINEFT